MMLKSVVVLCDLITIPVDLQQRGMITPQHLNPFFKWWQRLTLSRRFWKLQIDITACHQQMAVLQQSAISGTNMVEHLGMDNLPVHTNKIGFMIAVGRKQRIALSR